MCSREKYDFSKKSSVVTEEMINEWNKILENPRDKFFIRALFEGVGSDIDNLEVKDVNVNEGILNLRGIWGLKDRTIRVSKELCELAIQAADATVYRGIDYYGKYKEYSLIGSSDLVFKDFDEIPNPLYNYKTIRAINSINQQLGSTGLNCSTIIHGGIIHYINTRCKELGISARRFLFDPTYESEITRLDNQFGTDFHIARKDFYIAYVGALYNGEAKTSDLAKSQDYLKGYEDGKMDVLKKIRAELEGYIACNTNED